MNARRLVLSLLVALAPAFVCSAVAWACNPQAHIALDKTVYEAGATITVHGSYFAGDATITVSGPVDSTVVVSSPGGGFETQLTAPAESGVA